MGLTWELHHVRVQVVALSNKLLDLERITDGGDCRCLLEASALLLRAEAVLAGRKFDAGGAEPV